ncbi:hypothetical protein HMPREF9123_2421 [Neisseria bacilliformis ATCC BAA-1200]|uniref:Uncharacterized protein n=1 Tax=Neisseria bacilliformis ATCC BAA-1200 TaxID=888742 RepID=F2BFB4_9NEIS|nr:hypothetical protein HMPREF9123_2421 [Neisseria bacilliformis ATCC BAA-1200]
MQEKKTQQGRTPAGIFDAAGVDFYQKHRRRPNVNGPCVQAV